MWLLIVSLTISVVPASIGWLVIPLLLAILVAAVIVYIYYKKKHGRYNVGSLFSYNILMQRTQTNEDAEQLN